MKSENPQYSTTDGQPPAPGFENASAPQPVKTDGQHAAYWILSEAERSKGFVRPVRRGYIHRKCGSETIMGLTIAETYARDPKFYGATFCVKCARHFLVREFNWSDGAGVVGE